MTDSSWDNGGYGQPTKPGMPTWAKVMLGCGVAAVLAMATCVGGGMYIAHRIKKDPQGFERRILGLAADQVRPEWEDFRKVVENLRTPEGCKALYAANPGLATTWPKEAAFLEAARAWQSTLPSAPDLTPDLMKANSIQIHREFGGPVRIFWHPKAGPSVAVTFDHARKAGDPEAPRVLQLEVR